MPLDLRLSLLALCSIKRLSWNLIAREAQGPDGLERLLAGEVTEASEEAASARTLIAEHLSRIDSYLVRAERDLERAEAAGVRMTTVLNDDYPANLRVIYNLPPFLFYRGTLLPEDARAVAVVGTRTPTSEGIARAKRMAAGLAAESVTVLSGLAAGIDTAAHRATLDAGGRTVAVLGTGILRCYPEENAELAEEIAERGALVSQFWPTQPPTRYTFPRRNVVTSGLGQGTVVVEATSTSGAKMQARLAILHGKQVFLMASLVTNQPWARRYVADKGALEVRSVEDVVARLRAPREIEELSAQRRQLVLEGL